MEVTHYQDNVGTINSVYPPTEYLTFGPWIYMVPQFKPQSVLLLGYAGGTVAGLIRLLYGDVPITAVDIEPCEDRYGVDLITTDAEKFVKICGKYEVVVIDLFPNSSFYVCDFILKEEFVANLKRIAKYIIINTVNNPDLSAYKVFKHVGTNKPYKLGNKIYYFSNGDTHKLYPLW